MICVCFFNDLKRGGSHLACIFFNIELLNLVGFSCFLVPIKVEEENATFNDKNIGDGLCRIVVEDFKKQFPSSTLLVALVLIANTRTLKADSSSTDRSRKRNVSETPRSVMVTEHIDRQINFQVQQVMNELRANVMPSVSETWT